jgi:hypothetical protein
MISSVNTAIGLLAVTLLLGGCSTPPANPQAAEARAFAAPTQLTARLATPIDIDLKWKDNATNEAGYFVEYSPNADNDYVIIEALPPNSTHYRHPHLLPQTRFVFRVRPFFGLASNPIEFKTGKEGPQQEPGPELLPDAPPSTATKQSLRALGSLAGAAATDLTAMLIPPAGVKLQWQDHASDEAGFLLEIKPEWDSQFKVSSFIEPDTTSLISYNFPFDSKFTFRVRAFVYGQPSNLAEQTTGVDPTLGSGPWIKSDAP